MDEFLRKEIVETMKSIHQRIGETVLVEDWISTESREYDRHQTRYGKQIIRIDEFSIRTSGSIATIYSENQQIEFRSDSIKSIIQNETSLVIEINMTADVWRRIKINKINSVDK